MNPAEPTIIDLAFLDQGRAWLILALAQIVGNILTGWMFRRVRPTERTPRRSRRPRRARVGARHASAGRPWRGEIPDTWVMPVIHAPTPAPTH